MNPKRDGLYKNHTSSGAILAADGLADYFVTGEHEQHTPKEGRPLGDWLPEDEYLAFYSYRVTGIPCYGSLINPWSWVAFDGVPVSQTHLLKLYPVLTDGRFEPYRSGGDNDVRRSCHMFWPAFADFADGELIGFWRSAGYVATAASDAYANKYIRVSIIRDKQADRVLLLAANLGDEERFVSLKPALKKLGLNPDTAVARDVYTREGYDARQILCRIKPENVRLIIVRNRYRGTRR